MPNTTTPVLTGVVHSNITSATAVSIATALDNIFAADAQTIYSISPTNNTLKILTYTGLGLSAFTAILQAVEGASAAPAA